MGSLVNEQVKSMPVEEKVEDQNITQPPLNEAYCQQFHF